MNCPQCKEKMIRTRATNYGPDYDYCRNCKQELAEMQKAHSTGVDFSVRIPAQRRIVFSSAPALYNSIPVLTPGVNFSLGAGIPCSGNSHFFANLAANKNAFTGICTCGNYDGDGNKTIATQLQVAFSLPIYDGPGGQHSADIVGIYGPIKVCHADMAHPNRMKHYIARTQSYCTCGSYDAAGRSNTMSLSGAKLSGAPQSSSQPTNKGLFWAKPLDKCQGGSHYFAPNQGGRPYVTCLCRAINTAIYTVTG